MCGITGFLDLQGARSDDDLRALVTHMADQIQHRGPDGSGVWVDAASGVALGHRRLAIIDLTQEGAQPMGSASGRYVITYNGEIYNYQALREELGRLGHRWRGHSDTEVMLAAFEQWGVQPGVERLVGMFAFALWDRQERRLYLVRDRLGEKPLYYGWMGGTFLFGSELKALRAHPAFRAEINRDALALFLKHNCIPSPYTIYSGIYKLPPASLLVVDRREAEPTFYWSARETAEHGAAAPFEGSDDEAITMLDGLLREAVRLQMVADVPLGAFLSGGIDSSTIVSLMQAQSSRPVRTFTIGYQEADYNEAVYARAVAAHLGTDHTELYVTPDEARDVIPLLPALYDEPFSDASQIPTYLVAKLARQHVTVSLSGDGGDELFAGYIRYHKWQKLWRRFGWIPPLIRHGGAAALSTLSPQAWAKVLTPFSPMLPLNPGRMGYRVHTFAEVLRQEPTLELYLREMTHSPDVGSVSGIERPIHLTDTQRWPRLDSFFQQMLYLDMVAYLPNDILVKVDRASMGVSLESRVPILDHRVVEFSWRLPLAMKVRGGQGKWILRQVLYRYVPRELVERPKKGFSVPIGSWLRGPLRDWAEDLLDSSRLRQEGYFNPEPIRQKWDAHLNGARGWDYHLWDVLMFQAWLASQERVLAA